MILSLELNNFRNWSKKVLEFDPVTVLIGPNGIGKSNLLEAITMLGTSRSYRTQSDKEVVQWGKDFSRLVAALEDKNKIELGIRIENNSIIKKLKIQDSQKKIVEMLGIMPVVIFTPEAIDLVIGSPKTRRRFLDILLSQIDRQYVFHLIQFQRILRNRNHILQLIRMNSASLEELNFWNKEMINEGAHIFKKRLELVDDLNQKIKEFYADISGNKDILELKYLSVISGQKKEINIIEDYYRNFLYKIQGEEISRGLSLCGPHRDNFQFLINDKDSAKFSSRGEIRSIVLALKMAELESIKKSKKIKNPPILLLDDVFSELDENRRRHLFRLTLAQQTIITTTDVEHVKELKGEAKVELLK